MAPKPTAIAVHARIAADAPWREVGRSSGSERVTLAWPADWRDAIVTQVKFELTYAPDTAAVRVDRLLLYPRADAFRGGLRAH